VWTAIAVATWHPFTAWLVSVVGASADSLLPAIGAGVVAAIAYAVLAVATAFTAVAILAMPVIVRTVATRDFPALAARRGGTFAGSLGNALAALAIFAPLWIVSLVLLFVPPIYAVVSLLLNAWLTQRMFRYDALAEHADPAEIRALLDGSRGRLMGLGLLLAPLSLVPIVNVLVLPLFAGIAFTELCLGELVALRATSPSRAT
ncbi:MAG TPA: EI24 domain-containing protein, partial [Casimicrobiaceae bacterium]